MVQIASRIGTRAIDLASLSILGRLLTPADFGLVAIAMSILTVVEAVTEMPIVQSLVRLPDLTRSHYDTAFTFSAFRAAALGLALVIAAWPVARIYGDDRLIPLLCVLWLGPAIRGLGSPLFVDVLRSLNFSLVMILEIAGKCVAFTVAVSLAWATRSYWSIIAGTLAAPFTAAFLSYLTRPYRPRLSLKSWRDCAAFIGWSTAGQILAALNWQMDQLIVGRSVSRLELGRFAMAANLAMMPTQIVVTQLLAPFMVAFSLINTDRPRLAAAYKNSVATLVAIGIPGTVGLCMLAEPVVRLLLGDQWLPSVPLFRMLLIAALPSFFVAPVGPLFMALGETKALFGLALIELAIKIPLILLAIVSYGLLGVTLARIATAIAVAGWSMILVRKLTGLSVAAQVGCGWRPAISTLAMACAILPLARFIGGQTATMQLFAVAVTVLLGASVYAGCLGALWKLSGSPEGFEARAFRLGTGLAKSLSWPIRPAKDVGA